MVRGRSEALLTSRCEFHPTRPTGLPDPLNIYQEIFSFLHPRSNPDMDYYSYEVILSRLYPVCKAFAKLASRESWRRLAFTSCFGTDTRTRDSFWFTNITKKLEVAESVRADVKEFILRDWAGMATRLAALEEAPEPFLDRFPRLLSTLENIEMIALSEIPISYSLLQAIGRLPRLDRMVISECSIGTVDTYFQVEPMFRSTENPFPALRSLTILDPKFRYLPPPFLDIFLAIVSSSTLRVLAIPGNYWVQTLLPHVSRQLVSFAGNFSTMFFDEFLEFIRKHPLLEDLTICSNTERSFFDHWDMYRSPRFFFSLPADELPNLRSFSGPFYLAPAFLRGRPVTKLALGCHLTAQDSVPPLTAVYGLTVFPHTYRAVYSWDELYSNNFSRRDCLEDIGGGVEKLFLRPDLAVLPLHLIPLRFPNLVHLQLEPWSWTMSCFYPHSGGGRDFILAVGDVIKCLRFLRILTLSDTDVDNPSRYHTLWLSPGDQHNFVHRLFRQNFPTLKMIVFSPWMVWHMRGPVLKDGKPCCDLELLSTGNICVELRRLACCDEPFRVPVRDWKGKLVRAFGDKPFGYSEDVQDILKAMLLDSSWCA